MRVGIDLSPFASGNRMRGTGIYAENLLRALAEIDRANSYFLLVLTATQNVEALGNLPDNFHPVVISVPPLGRATPLVSHQLILPLYALRLGLDVLHCIGVPFNPSQPGVPWWQTVPTVVTVHDLTPLVIQDRMLAPRRYRLFYWFQLRAVRRAVHLIGDSVSTGSDLMLTGIVPRERLTIIPLAAPHFDESCNDDAFEIPPLPFILHVGGADLQKDQATVLRAFGMLCRDAAFQHRLVLVGGHHLGDEIAAEIEPRAAGRIIRFSNLSRAGLQSLYRRCDVFVFPSRYEGFGLPILEAMSCGAPVVAARASSIPEVAGDAAILVEPADYLAVAIAIKQMIADRSLRDHYIQAGYQQVRQFSWTRTAQQTRAVYEQAAHSHVTP